MRTEAATQVAIVVSEVRTLDRFIAPVQERFWALARNLWWSWDHDSVSLFLDLDPARWNESNDNPVSLLGEYPLARLEARAAELVLHSRINYAYRRLREYLEADRTWGARHAGVLRPRPVAYFSAEFGLHESLPVYSGGLGVLAGDHIKSASDLGIPLVGVGLFYGRGYFRQRLDQNGWHQGEYLTTDVSQMPMEPAIRTNGSPVVVQVNTISGCLRAKLCRVEVGRRDLILRESHLEGNAPGDRELTSTLYGGYRPNPILQKLLLRLGRLPPLPALRNPPPRFPLHQSPHPF